MTGTDPGLAGRRVAAIAVLTKVNPDHARAILREVAANGPDGHRHVAAGVLANLSSFRAQLEAGVTTATAA